MPDKKEINTGISNNINHYKFSLIILLYNTRVLTKFCCYF